MRSALQHPRGRGTQDELARAVQRLPQEHFDTAMALIVGSHPELHPGSMDMARPSSNFLFCNYLYKFSP